MTLHSFYVLGVDSPTAASLRLNTLLLFGEYLGVFLFQAKAVTEFYLFLD